MSILRTSLCVLLSFMMVAIPLSQSLAQESSNSNVNDYLSGMADGQRDAKGGGIWFFAGLCLGTLGFILAYVVEPSVDTGRLMGKSPEYVRGYIEGYKKDTKKKQVNNALYGCIAGTILWIGIYVIIFVALASDDDLDDDYYYYKPALAP